MSEQEDQSIEKLKNFMRTLLHAGCVPEFIMEQGFNYAILLQREKALVEDAILFGPGGQITEVYTTWMEQAALWLVEVTRDTD